MTMNTQKIFMIILTLGMLLTSCDESSWLKEEPLDFYSPDNSYQTSAQFRQAENNLYNNCLLYTSPSPRDCS